MTITYEQVFKRRKIISDSLSGYETKFENSERITSKKVEKVSSKHTPHEL